MRTKLLVTGLVLGIAILALGAAGAIILWLGWLGVAIDAFAAAGIVVAYLSWIGPWQRRWGASDAEMNRVMPGDEIIPDAASTTRAITVAAPPEEVWPWLVQIGFDRAGWYSYDWIDNDGRPSADRIIPELQALAVGDQLPMLPDMGPRVRTIEPTKYLLSGDEILGTWCLALYRTTEGTRLVSRWRVGWRITPASVFWILIADPGAFIMERKMLLGIKERAEGHHAWRRPPATWAA
jgi:hypothetical protein